MYISKPLRWKHLELSEKKIKNQQEKKMPKIRLILSIICHRYFDTNHFITWFVYFLVCFGDNQLIPRGRGGVWPELSKQCYNLSCTMCRMHFLSNILTWLILPGPLRIKLFAYEIKNVCFLSHSCLLGQIHFI